MSFLPKVLVVTSHVTARRRGCSDVEGLWFIKEEEGPPKEGDVSEEFLTTGKRERKITDLRKPRFDSLDSLSVSGMSAPAR